MWKKDLKGAYNLITFRAEDVPLMATELVDENNPGETVIMVFLCGIFGWTGTPGAFSVVTRAIVFEVGRLVSGMVTMYVDDLIGVCLRRDLEHDDAAATRVCTELLGDDAVATEKDENGRRLDAIGYTLDLDKERVTIAKKNFRNTIHGYFAVDLGTTVTVRALERLASWGSRYKSICAYLKPFNQALYDAYAGRHHHARVPWPPAARRAVRLWRAILVALGLDEDRFARPLSTFVCRTAGVVIETDASLGGAGCLVYRRMEDGSERCVGGSSTSLWRLGFGSDSSNQNVAEFVGIILGILTVKKLGITEIDVELRTDSEVALRWAEKENPHSDRASNAAILFTMLQIAKSVSVTSTAHISGDDNWRCDRLSRTEESRQQPGEVMKSFGYGDVELVELGETEAAAAVLGICDPSRVVDDDDAGVADRLFGAFWGQIRSCIATHF